MAQVVKIKKYKGYIATITTYKAIGRSHIGYKFESPLALTRKLAQLIKKHNLGANLQGRDVACYVHFNNLEISLHL